MRSGNRSLGVSLLAALTRKVAAALGAEFDIEIVEMHHRMKIDAPSGTALLLGEAAAAGTVDPRDGRPLAEVVLDAPILYPGALFCAGANYWDHLQEMAEIAARTTGKAPAFRWKTLRRRFFEQPGRLLPQHGPSFPYPHSR